MPEEIKPVEEKKKKERKGKGKHKNKPTSQKWKHYKVSGSNLIKAKHCPRCGPGIFLMQADNRLYCGKCHYTSFDKEEIAKAK